MNDFTIGFIGLGLIGGSIARSMKEHHPDYYIIAYNYHKNSANPALSAALSDHTIDTVSKNLSTDFASCDLIYLCAPVLTNISYLKELKSIIKPDCILTDVGSVKSNIHAAVHSLGLDANFIGGHPMAASEKTGYESSHSKLLENAYYILTPTAQTTPSMIDTLRTIAIEMTALPIILDAKEHDDITAAISHVPHIIASALVNLVKDSDNEQNQMALLAAGGFRDITRIASSSPIMWQNICLTNKESIRKYLAIYQTALSKLDSLLDCDTAGEAALLGFFEEAKEFRDSLPIKGHGAIQKSHEIFMDIRDEAGAIATVATTLATNGISIKNIGLIHNREFRDGVLHIEFYQEEASEQAIELLRRYNYTIYEN